MDKLTISVIVPFYKGNKYLLRLCNSVNNVAIHNHNKAQFELILVNDSPEENIILPNIEDLSLEIRIYQNDKNYGIQKTRINGLSHANGEWIVFLDQDDELMVDGYEKQIDLTRNADVVVGNVLYEFENGKKLFYKNYKEMKYLIKEERFIKIHNMIPSPGHCLIKKDAIPSLWKDNPLSNNGSDDYFLWILMFVAGRKFVCNEQCVYIHNDSDGKNLSLDLDKMYMSNNEMLNLLINNECLDKKNTNRLRMSIEFKYYQDKKKINLFLIFKYGKTIFDNIIYKTKKSILEITLR